MIQVLSSHLQFRSCTTGFAANQRAIAIVLRSLRGALLFVLLSALATVATRSAVAQQKENSNTSVEQRFLSNVVQLTFDGRRSGEGYFNSDGTEMVFQSERRADNPFFQIYTLDLETGDTTDVSPGFGKTTCAWIHPDGNRVLYASTQQDAEARQKQIDEIAFRESGQQRRYSWDYDPTYELTVFDRATGKYQFLTDSHGYDAEASYSPDGQWIAFASNRSAFEQPMDEATQEKFDRDPAVMMEIYLMRSDGSDLRRLTDVPGYDGGPFFSPDGKRICWRRFREDGLTAEIFTMNVDGSDVRQLTHMNVMSWAPFYHPSGEYLIFTTNKHGFGNFELYLVDANGDGPPVRVTQTDGFDGLASFSPDGKTLTWTSNRNSQKQSQIYLADWNHEAAMKRMAVAAAATPAGSDSSGDSDTDADADKVALGNTENPDPEIDAAYQQGQSAARDAAAGFEPLDVMRHVDYLCRKELGGRMTGSVGERRATAYVAAYLSHLGLRPEGDAGSVPEGNKATWFEQFDFPNGAKLGQANELAWKGNADNEDITSSPVALEVDRDFRPLTFSANASVNDCGVVFAGYGIVAPATDAFEEYDSYVHLDVKDKWVLVFRYVPEDITPEQRQHLNFYAGLRKKAFHARKNGAAGLIVVSGPSSQVRKQLIPLQNDFAPSGSSIAAISVTDEVVSQWFAATGKDLQQAQAKLDSGEPAMGYDLPGLTVSATVDLNKITGSGRNVVGRLQWEDSPSDEVVVVGAHIDHLGGGGSASSLAREDEQQQIHVGADDNASGVAAMLEVAQYLASKRGDPKFSMKRDVIFVAFSGEELGLHGSRHFVDHRVVDAGSSQSAAASEEVTSGEVASEEAAAVKPGAAASPHDFVVEIARDGSVSLNGEAEAMQSLEPSLKFMGSSSPDFPVEVVADPNVPASFVIEFMALASKYGLKNVTLKAAPVAAEIPADNAMAEEKRLRVVAALNMDMVGRMTDKLVLQGIGSSPQWLRKTIERKNAVVRLPITLSDDTDLPTDATSFYQAGIPILSAFTGSHTDYHTPRDTPEKLNYPAAARIARLMALVTAELATTDALPQWQKQESKVKGAARGGVRAYLGTVPSYGDDVVGVKLADVTTGAPAEVAGVLGGDIIIGLAGQKIENIYDYTAAIDGLKIGQQTTISVNRNGTELKLDIVPTSRD